MPGAVVTRHFLYILRCRDNTLYTGYTTDPERRLREHNSGRGSKYTRARRPTKLVYLEERRTRSEALSREYQIKRMGRRSKLLLCRDYQRSKRHGPS